MEIIKILLTPQVSDKKNFKYNFNDDVLTIKIGDKNDTFDFTGLPDGRLEMYDKEGNELIQTTLRVNPLIKAEKKDGVLYLTLLNRIGIDATYEEKFPEWIDAKDYVFKENGNSKEVDNGEVELEESEGN